MSQASRAPTPATFYDRYQCAQKSCISITVTVCDSVLSQTRMLSVREASPSLSRHSLQNVAVLTKKHTLIRALLFMQVAYGLNTSNVEVPMHECVLAHLRRHIHMYICTYGHSATISSKSSAWVLLSKSNSGVLFPQASFDSTTQITAKLSTFLDLKFPPQVCSMRFRKSMSLIVFQHIRSIHFDQPRRFEKMYYVFLL